MKIKGIKTPIIEPGENIVEIILNTLKENEIENEDVLVIASSVISTSQNRIRKIKEIEPSEEAKSLAEKSGLEEKFVEIIVREADKILATYEDCILTIKDGMLRINAGVDRTNVGPGKALLLPENPNETAEELRKKFEEETGKKIGVIIGDSHVHPLRRGTTGQSLGSSGLKVALDCRNQEDLFGRRLKITFRGIGDQLAAAAQLVMGEADERIPAVIIRGAEAPFSEKSRAPLKVPPKECAYSEFFDYEGKNSSGS